MPRLLAGLDRPRRIASAGNQFGASLSTVGSPGETVWILLRFFTIITKLIVAVTMTAIALDRRISPFLLAGVTLAIGLVGIVYATLLHGLVRLEGGALIADMLLHYVVPTITAVDWLVVAPKYGLRWHHPLLWSLYPLAISATRSCAGRSRASIPIRSWIWKSSPAQTALNAIGLAAAFVIAGLAMVAFSRLVGRNRARPLARSRTAQRVA